MFSREDFVRESNRIEGILRDPTTEEIEAHNVLVNLTFIQPKHVIEFVAIVTKGCGVLRDKVGMDVRVGGRYPPRGGPKIAGGLKEILINVSTSQPYTTHIEYELLHPFTDGNGRSGRAIWLWQSFGCAQRGFLHQFYYQTLSQAQGVKTWSGS